jgi:hypothetical protein
MEAKREVAVAIADAKRLGVQWRAEIEQQQHVLKAKT